MFKPSRIHHTSCGKNYNVYVPETFALLCWNVYKNNQENPRFEQFLQSESKKKNLDFMLLQEAGFKDNQTFELPYFSYNAAANLEFRKQFYGVLTASRTESNEAKAYLSEGRESLFGPHKSLLLTRYHFEDGESLLILNVHAINFRESKRYAKELERFLALMKVYSGAMIFAGDFNTWNTTRMSKLKDVAKELDLLQVDFSKTGQVKSFMGKALDFIFYRGVELLDAEVITNHKLSDHHPLFVKFKKK